MAEGITEDIAGTSAEIPEYLRIITDIHKRVTRIKAGMEFRLALYDKREWDSIDEGRRPQELHPNIQERLNMIHLQPGLGLIHYLTWHGPYGKYLRRIEKRPDDQCSLCNTTETLKHVLFQCEGTRAHGGDEREKFSVHTIGDVLRDKDL